VAGSAPKTALAYLRFGECHRMQIKPFWGQEPTGERVFMRVCDWWHRESDLLVENRVFVDIPHALLQLGYDLLEAP